MLKMNFVALSTKILLIPSFDFQNVAPQSWPNFIYLHEVLHKISDKDLYKKVLKFNFRWHTSLF